MKRVLAFLLFSAASALPLLAVGPTFDNSGNSMLSGSYYFRHVLYGISTSADTEGIYGDISEAVAIYGTIAFDGNGNYSISASALASDSYAEVTEDPLSCYLAGTTCSATQGTAVAGTYAVSSNGLAYIVNPVTGDKIFGLVSANGVFVGSSTESTESYNDLFIAAAVPSPLPTNSFFSGSYSVAGFFPGGSPLDSEDAFFQVSANAGSLGTVNINGYAGNGSTTSQSVNVTYSFSSGAAVLSFPTNNNADFFVGGAQNPEYLYFSPDGNFFFGGSPTNGYDMIVGVRNNSGGLNFGGGALYYQAGLDQDESTLSSGYAGFDGYYGAFNPLADGNIVQHVRLDVNSAAGSGTYGDTYADTFPVPISSTYTDTAADTQYAIGGGGIVRIGQDVWPEIGITVALQAPSFSGSGVYLNPTGIVNAASFSPFTAGVSNGEMVTIFGTGLAPTTVAASSLPLPTNLGGVQVTVNGTPAPLNYVSPTQILLNVPFGNTFDVAQFQVNNNGNLSNTVTELVNETTPGVFTGDYGLGYGYVQHAADNSLVTEASPAEPGETVVIYASGLGIVYPTVADGAAAPSSPPAAATNTISVDIGGVDAPAPTFAGLVPTLSGLYQIDVEIPSGAAEGDQTLDISGPDSYTTQTLIPIGSGLSAAARQPSAKARPKLHAKSAAPKAAACFYGVKTGCKARKTS